MFYLAALFVILIILLVFIYLKKKSKHLEESLKMSLFLIRLPKYEIHEKKEKVDIKDMISRMEQFYSNFIHLGSGYGLFKKFFNGLPRVVFEIASEVGEGDISFYIAIPLEYENSLNKYVQGVYPGAILEKKKDDYTIFELNSKSSASYLKLKNSFYIPINTYKDLGGDPLESITNSIANINPDEGSAIQIILRKSPVNLAKKGSEILSLMTNKGLSLDSAISQSSSNKLYRVINKEKDDNEIKKTEDLRTELIKSKIKKPSLEVNIRLLGVSKDKKRSLEILNNLESGFSQFSSGDNGFKPKRIKRRLNNFIYSFCFRNFNRRQSIILNTEEISSIYHFPLSHMESPHIKWVKTKESAPPSDLPKSGLFIGEAVYRGEEKPVYVASKEDRRRHFYVIGQTGTGKTTLLREMIRQDIEKGEGVGVIDPHGDLIEDTLANIPKERAGDVVIFEPFDMERPCGLNMLEWNHPEQKDLAISEMIMIFSSLFPPEFIGPNFEHYMRNAMLGIMADKNNPGTLVEIPRIFTDDNFMEEKLSKVSDPLVRNFWLREWKQTTGQTRSDMLGYVVSKIGRFIENEMMRNIIGQGHSSFDINEIMDSKKIFLANLSKGLTGEINSSLLGLILVSKMQMAALRRARIPQEERNDFYLYVDEFQNFTTNSITTILSEARKYRLNLILAHQYMPQLKEEIKNAVIGNIGTIVSYRVGSSDSEFLENQFTPEFSRFDLSNLDNFQYLIKMLINNKTSYPFKANAPKPKKGDRELGIKIKELSKSKYGKPKSVVDKEIIERSNIRIS